MVLKMMILDGEHEGGNNDEEEDDHDAAVCMIHGEG